MTTTEDRLRGALSAKADLVQPEDLSRTPAPLARPTRLTPRSRRPLYALVAAAAVAAVAVPTLLVNGSTDEPGPAVTAPETSIEGEDVTLVFFPSAASQILEGGSFTLAEFDQQPGNDRISLVEAPDGADLVFAANGGPERTVGLRGSGDFAVYDRPIDIDDRFGAVLVAQEGSSEAIVVVALDDGPVRIDPLERAGTPPLGWGALPDGTAYRTWIGPDRELFTRVASPDARDGRQEFYRWRLADELEVGGDNVRGMRAQPVGTYCVEESATPYVTDCGD